MTTQTATETTTTAPITLTDYLVAALDQRAPCYRQRSPTEIARAYLLLDLEERTLSLAVRYQGDGVSGREWRGLIQPVAIPNSLTGRGLREVVEDRRVLDLCAAACDGADSDETLDAMHSLEIMIDRVASGADHVEIWQAGDWLEAATSRRDGEVEIDGLGTIRAATTDEELAEIEDRIEEAARTDNVMLMDLSEYLGDLRTGL